ncbi:MAG: MmcQ/YjbR family DNA-binding protein [Nocardioides sp.]
MNRPASADDIGAICRSLPEVEFGVTWGDRPTYKVPAGPKGRGFVLYRAPRKDAIDPSTGEMYDDLVVIVVPDEHAKLALVDDPSTPFFTIDHFNGYNAVLVRESRLGELDVAELREVIVDAWSARAPRALVTRFLDKELPGEGVRAAADE